MIQLNNLSTYPILIKNCTDFLQLICKEISLNDWNIELTFCSKELSMSLNSQHLSHHYPTDILTFDLSYNSFKVADIYICLAIAEENASTFKVSFENEIKRLIIHGLLHLKGYNDLDEIEKKEMFAIQESLLNKLESSKKIIDVS